MSMSKILSLSDKQKLRRFFELIYHNYYQEKITSSVLQDHVCEEKSVVGRIYPDIKYVINNEGCLYGDPKELDDEVRILFDKVFVGMGGGD